MLPILKNITHYTKYGIGIAVASSSSVLTIDYIIKDNEKNNERLSKLNNTVLNTCVK
jgi:hypothetical protein